MTASTKTAEPIRLHWWRGVPNFGDAINPLIVGHVSGAEVEFAGPQKANLFAIGSMLQVVKRTRKDVAEDQPPVNVWGTGILNPVFGHDFLEKVDVHLVRGPITAALLKQKLRRFGDPGLLIDSALPFDGTRNDRVGIVPHHGQMDDPEMLAFAASDPAFMLIDPRDDAKQVCHQIASCAQVMSSSLHGLIMADAYGVPNRWIAPGKQGWLKYHDYAASIGRSDMSTPLTIDDAPKAAFGEIGYQDGIDAAREALLDSFPDHLKSGA
ncbi:polysaccharide pyruvyl transferase family protein [uncultured Sulfitobacter sp.]|uniref:polysaccharide pyruvyl transferase family protein n=1 Tax=uncultured Sulfitobacter sp. TaxID=191468 RepID=UPI00261DA38C|nr:polysaccharide pyruvyl transferase family protein [uncultured Sulfitobacter sp.]